MINTSDLSSYVDSQWDNNIIPTLMDFIKIPNKSPLYDSNWQQHGYIDKAASLINDWCKKHAPETSMIEILRDSNRTPVIYIEIPGQSDETVLLYGHFDKQPEMKGWASDLGPWKPVLKADKLYGRGAADDGYSAFAALTAVNALRKQKIPHARCIILIEASEESGSVDLPYYLDSLYQRIGSPSLIVCLDSGCGNYDQLWLTTSLRGNLSGNLRVELISEGVHSGNASGIVPSSFRVMQQLIARIEDPATGEILAKELFVKIPEERLKQASAAADVLGREVYQQFPFKSNTQPVTHDLIQLILNRTWRPALSVIGIAGLPRLEDAGNVMLPYTEAKLSIRIPPHCDPDKAASIVKKMLEQDPPYKAHVQFEICETVEGWEAPKLSQWLEEAITEASKAYFGKPATLIGEGATIPFMGMLGKKFPKAEFVITGVLGPHSNAHGPNEFLHVPMGKRVTSCVAHILSNHFRREG